MSFSLSGITITQTGTDTPATVISGLGAIAGVTQTAMGQYTKLRIPYKLIINGIMEGNHTIKYSFERGTIFENEVVVNGTWIAKSVRTTNSTNDYYELPSVDFNNTAVIGYNGNTNNCIYVVGGTLDFAAVTVNADGGQYWNGGLIKYRRVVLNAQNVPTPNDCQFSTQLNNPSIDWDDVTIVGGSLFIKDSNIINLKNYKPRYMIAGVGQGFGVTRTFENFAPFGNQNDASIYQGGTIIFNNPLPGGALKVGPWAAPSNVNAYIRTNGTIRITAINEFGAAVNDFKVYKQDNITNAYTGVHNGVTAGVQNVYNGTSVGNILDLTVMTGESVTCQSIRRRSATQTDDLFSFPMVSFLNKVSNTGNIDLAGINRKDKTVIAPTETEITVTNKVTIAAYTELNSSAKFFDFAKLFFFNNYLGETDFYLTRSALTIDAGALNVTINAAAAAVFAKAGNLLTIKAATYAGEIKTTGTLTANMTTGGAYTYVNGAADSPTTVPSLTGGTLNIGAAGAYNLNSFDSIFSLTPAAPSTYTFTGTHGGTLSLKNTSAHAITVVVPAGTAFTTAANIGGTITVVNPATTFQILRPNIINGSNFIVRNVTQAIEIASGTCSGGTGINVTFTSGTHYNANDALEIQIGYCVGVSAKLAITEQLTAPTITSVNNAPTMQEDYAIYNSLAINGSAVTGFTADYAQQDVNVTLGSDFLGQNFMAWWVYNESTLNGLRNFTGLYTLVDAANMRNNANIALVTLDNTSTNNIKQVDNIRIYCSDGTYPVKQPSTGGGAIDVNWRNPVLITGLGAVAQDVRIEMDTNSTKLDVAVSTRESTTNANANAAAIPAAVFAGTSEAGQSYGKQIRDIRAAVLGITTGGGTTTETFKGADNVTVRVTSVNNGTDRTSVTLPGV